MGSKNIPESNRSNEVISRREYVADCDVQHGFYCKLLYLLTYLSAPRNHVSVPSLPIC